jgi:hypothetical protein
MNNKDFNPEEYYKQLEQKFLQSDKFPKYLIECLDESNTANNKIKDIIRTLIKEDVQCQKDITSIADKLYQDKLNLAKENVRFIKLQMWDKWGVPIILIVITSIVSAIVTLLFKQK